MSQWNQCLRCAKPKTTSYSSICDDCKANDRCKELMKELDEWVKDGFPDFAHRPGSLTEKIWIPVLPWKRS